MRPRISMRGPVRPLALWLVGRSVGQSVSRSLGPRVTLSGKREKINIFDQPSNNVINTEIIRTLRWAHISISALSKHSLVKGLSDFKCF